MSQKRVEYVSKTSWGRVNNNSLTWWYFLKASWRSNEDIFGRRFEDVFKTFWQDTLKMSWRRLENAFKTSWKRMTKVNILVLNKTSWKRLEDVFWRRMTKANIFVLIKTSWRRHVDVFRRRRRKTSWRPLQDIFKTSSSRRMFAGLSPAVIAYFFYVQQNNYNLRHNSYFTTPNVESVYHGTKSLSNLKTRIWNSVPDKLKQLVDVYALRKTLKSGSQKTA